MAVKKICEKHNVKKVRVKWRQGKSMIVKLKCPECLKEDLTPLVLSIEAAFQDFFPGQDRPALAVAFTLPPGYDTVHWITNVSREDGIAIFEETAKKMKASKL